MFRYEGGENWTDCGKIGDVYTVTGLVTFDGQLYATTCDSYGCPTRTEACYRYEGGQEWTFVGNPGGRMGAFVIHNNSLYGTVFGEHGFARYTDDESWDPLGKPPNTSQTYSAAVYRGRICLGTWPSGSVFRFDGPDQFASLGQLGEEKEVMAMAVYNGKLYGGTLPLGQVYRYDGAEGWTDTGQLDKTPDVLYRRVWSMAVFQGQLFAGTLPSGHVYSLEAGKCVSHDRSLERGWGQIEESPVAVRERPTCVTNSEGRPVSVRPHQRAAAENRIRRARLLQRPNARSANLPPRAQLRRRSRTGFGLMKICT